MKHIITTIQRGARVNKKMLANLMVFAEKHGVEKISAFVMDGRHKEDVDIDPYLLQFPIELITHDKRGTALNSNLKVYDTMIRASQINPLTGFNKKLSRDHSYILPSPKVRYLSIPNTSKYPRFLCTTGSLTDGNYKLHTAQGRKANLEHQYGFVFINIKSGKKFDLDQIECKKDGGFNYMTEMYNAGKLYKEQPEALVLGDWHTGDTCPKSRAASIKQIETLTPKIVVFHDVFNGHSINHHEDKNFISKARLINQKRHELEKELKLVYKEVMFFAKKFPKVKFLVAESNHDIFLTTYLGTKNWLVDGQNSVIASKLFAPIVTNDKEPALKLALELMGELPSNFKFLREDEEFRVRGIGLDYHGHRGLNGSRGSSASFDRYNLKLITGHEHTPKLYANGVVVGTNTKLKLGYTKGASSWLNANAILYKSGKYALINMIL